MLTEALKTHAGITDAAIFVGLGHKFRIWEPGRFRAELAEATDKVRAFKAELGTRTAAAKPPRSTGMMTGSGSPAVAGGLARHIPVLARRAIDWLAVRAGGIYVDATFGAGGYTRAILATPGARVIGIDRDRDAIAAGAALSKQREGRLTLVEGALLQSGSDSGEATA